MNRLALFLIGLATPPVDRDAVVGDTIERFGEIRATDGDRAARRWLRRETRRVLLNAPQHRLATRPANHQHRPHRRSGSMSSVVQDVRYALRWFGRSPGFTAVAVLTLALGIGANTAMFSVVNAVLLKPLPFANADRLMLVHLLFDARDVGPGSREIVWSYPKYRTFTGLQQVFEDTALFSGRTYSLSGDGEPERVEGEIVTERYFPVLGVQPILGRSFTADEANRAGSEPVAIIGHSLWVRRHGRDPEVLGRRVDVGGVSHAIVGVLPAGFRGLSGKSEFWQPLAVGDASQLEERQSHSYTLVGRRKRDVSETAVQSAMAVYAPVIEEANRQSANDWTARSAAARSLYDSRVDSDLRQASLVVLGSVGFVLLIACVNLTNLLVARAVARQREVGIRIALGAGRLRMIRQFVVEGLLLSGLGAAGGLFVATGLLAMAAVLLPDADVFFRSAITPGTARVPGAAGLTRIGAGMIGLDAATLAVTAGLALVTAVLVSVLPALTVSGLRPSHVLRAAAGTTTRRGFGQFGSRAVLVGGEIAMAMVLLAGAGLMLKSAMRLHQTHIGIDPTSVLTAQIDLASAKYDATTGPLFQEALRERVGAIPGVDAAGWMSCAPVSGGCNGTILSFPNQPADDNARRMVGVMWVTPDYFDALRIPLVEGRSFTANDRVGQPKVVLVNEAAARAYWPGDSPIGKRVAVGQGGFHDGAEVVGIVADVRYRTIEMAAAPDVYLPLSQSFRRWMQFVVRSRLDPQTLVSAIGREVRALDPDLPLAGVSIKTMDERVGDAMWRTRVAAWLLSAFAGLALLLTAVGIFGVMAQTVAQRTSEIGIRMALGARRADVLRLVLGRAMVITALGLGVGLVAALGLTRVLTTLLYEVAPTDPATLVLVAVVLGAVSLLACYIPARRAMKVDAVTALRSE